MKPIITSVILSTNLTEYLDQQSLAIRRTSGAALSRSKLLRGIVGALAAASVDFSRCRSEKGVADGLGSLLSILETLRERQR
jgi:hypothetical protein